jgi:thiol:disulfide interchange protein DsbA
MNCETIDSILDGHLLARLAPVERQRAVEHLGACARCSAAWAADGALRGEDIADPKPELFLSVVRRISAPPARREAADGGRRWWLAGAAAAAAVLAVAALWSIVGSQAGAPLPIAAVEPPPAVASPFVAGRDYEVLPGATARVTAAATDGEIEVIEFFMFLCFPCSAFEPDLVRWQAQAPSDVSLERVPALLRPQAQLQARAYYTAEVLGKLDEMHAAFYDEIHERGNPLSSRSALADFFRRFEVDRATFDATFDGSDVDARLERAAVLNREYAIRATPTIVVGGRYATNPGLARGAMLDVVDHLVAEVRPCQRRCEDTRGR